MNTVVISVSRSGRTDVTRAPRVTKKLRISFADEFVTDKTELILFSGVAESKSVRCRDANVIPVTRVIEGVSFKCLDERYGFPFDLPLASSRTSKDL
ncbi:hypothetical protein X777_07226 [Ooceraea biroi]|uniref:Uncharacterized protein n=1 Tax=Ooceraea biroi TaxID=2015173 RepID=A0A026WAN9_OOCBI|nr:hypothetical protein X777_07226 [Ooceraea biroi]